MSYRDLRNFTEMMRALGYKRLISLENFKSPSFPLVAEILAWLALRFDPSADVPSEIDSAQDRITFMKYIVEFMATKANTKLNPKRLYGADGPAVKELLKVTVILYRASKAGQSDGGDNNACSGGNDSMSLMMELAGKTQELTEARKLATHLTGKGATLFDLLGKEVDFRMSRIRALAKQLEIPDIEKVIVQGSKGIEEEIQTLMSRIENVAADEANLEMKIEKKRAELERSRKRRDALQSVRPAYMDEMEKLEEELRLLYEDYAVKHCNASFLESIYDKYKKYEKDLGDMIENQVRRTLAKVSMPSKRIQLDEDLSDEEDNDGIDEDDDDNDDEEFKSRNRGLTGRVKNIGQRNGDPFNGFINRPTSGRHLPAKQTNFLLDNDDDDEDDLNLSGDSINIGEDNDDEEASPISRGTQRGKPVHHRMDARPVAAVRGSGRVKDDSKLESEGDDDDEEDDF